MVRKQEQQKKLRILIDFVHPADVNFFKQTIKKLLKQGHEVTCTVMNRGKLPAIIKKEYKGMNLKILMLGKHEKTKTKKIINIIKREYSFLKQYKKQKYDVVMSFGFYPLILSRIAGAKAIGIHDDQEYKEMFMLTKKFSDKFISLTPIKTKDKKTRIVRSMKETAYLLPKYLETSKELMKKLGLKKQKYIYIREIENISMNYQNRKKISYKKIISLCEKKGVKVIIHPESKEKEKKQDNNQIKTLTGSYLLKELNELKKQARLIITSGDTVLREAIILGVPVIYTSDREMKVNEEFKKQGLFEQATNEEELLIKTKKLLGEGIKERKKRKEKTKKLIKEMEDINRILYEEIIS